MILRQLLSEVLIREIFDRPEPYQRFQEYGSEFATFSIDGVEYKVGYFRLPNGENVFGFTNDMAEDPDHDITNQHKNSSRVFSTIIAFIREILEEDKPKIWMIDREDARKNQLYSKILTKMMSDVTKAGYKAYRYPDGTWKFFRDGIPPQPGYLPESNTARYFNYLSRDRT